ncbi:MAG: acyl dehydratase [Gammaproteobacteria bacterium]|jgi:acyl dehydratase
MGPLVRGLLDGRGNFVAGQTMTEGQTVSHAMTYDPQPFHIDTTAAAASECGGLIASGWQVAAVAVRRWR